MKKKKTRVSTVKCPKCSDEIYSRARHDFHLCSCGAVAIDGGFDYMKISFDPKLEQPKTHTRYVEATKEELYNDWNEQKNKYGKIHRA